MRRHFGWNKTVALAIGGLGALLKDAALGGPGAEVPYAAVILVERLNFWAAACMGCQFLAPASVLLRRLPRARRVFGKTRRALLVVCAASAVLPALETASLPENADTAAYLGWSLSTIAFAWAPLAIVESREWLRCQSSYRRLFLAGEGPSAGQASVRELRRRRFDPRRREGTFGFNAGLLQGRTLAESTHAPFPIRALDEQGTLLIGSARSGKSVRFLWVWFATNDQIKVVVDPKAHGYRLLAGRLSCADARRRFGPSVVDPEGVTRAKERVPDGRVHGWDPFGLGRPYPSMAINVVALIDPASDYCRVMLAAISQSIVIPTGDEQHWVAELTRLAIEGFVAHLRTARAADQQSLGYLADLFAGFERVEGDPRQRDEFRPIDTLLAEMRGNDACGGICRQAANAFESLEGREVGIIVSEVARSLKTFTDPVIRAATTGDGIDLRAVVESRTPVTLFLSLPFGAIVEHSRALRVIVSCLLRLTEQRRDKSRAVHFFLDEFAAYAKNLSAVRDATVTLGGAGARLHIALQYIEQLRQCLGPEAAAAFEASSNIVAAGLGDRTTAEYISQRFGTHNLQKLRGWWPFRQVVSEREVPVLDVSTVARLLDRKSRLGACIPGAGSPFLFETLAYKPLRLAGTPMGAWELPTDAFDDHLLATERGEAPVVAAPQPLRIAAAPQATPPRLTVRPASPPLRLRRPE